MTQKETVENVANPITARVWWSEEIRKSPAVNQQGFSILGWEMGLEPTTPGTTIRCSNQLSYTHHIFCIRAIFAALLRDAL